MWIVGCVAWWWWCDQSRGGVWNHLLPPPDFLQNPLIFYLNLFKSMFLLCFAPRLSELVFWREQKILFQGGETIPAAQIFPPVTIMMITDHWSETRGWCSLLLPSVRVFPAPGEPWWLSSFRYYLKSSSPSPWLSWSSSPDSKRWWQKPDGGVDRRAGGHRQLPLQPGRHLGGQVEELAYTWYLSILVHNGTI